MKQLTNYIAQGVDINQEIATVYEVIDARQGGKNTEQRLLEEWILNIT